MMAWLYIVTSASHCCNQLLLAYWGYNPTVVVWPTYDALDLALAEGQVCDYAN